MRKGKKEPALTETFCRKVEALRLGIELASGQRVKFKRLDLNTGNGQLFVGDEIKDIDFRFWEDPNDPFIDLYMGGDCLVIIYDESPIVHACNTTNPVRRKGWPQVISGTSLNDQWQQDHISFSKDRPCAEA
jgi:hypothetical protein